eukprot:CAMPEP_0198686846 /NCGR_PEP_ID=MMETSP1468-20131203/25842_1 /TAXON_ID=1461545 /ORGANISM="Mantoniella sp, Strain CCMP1436" /LENGTH=122 /DNA_ID=CAMNT_0044433401 /DNA_START=21 /DNA_END=389 /DNA_ORIENTATION=+
MLNAGGAQRGRASHWVTSGLPFLAFIVAGSIGVSVLLQGRNDVRDAKKSVNDLRAPATMQGLKKRSKKFDLDTEHERTMKQHLDSIDNYELVALVRPGEEALAVENRPWFGDVKKWFSKPKP